MDFRTLREADPSALETAAQAYAKLQDALQADQREWRDGTADPVAHSGWQGPAASAANGSVGRTGKKLDDTTTGLAPMSKLLNQGAVDIRAAQNDLRQTIDEATANGLRVGDDGSVSWEATPTAYTDEATAARADADLKQRAEQTSARIGHIVERAADTDQALSARLDAISSTARGLAAQARPA
ncbi:WXG100 family type VII secretion target [Kitasatospora sp. NBC_00240]|uniref:WXG100 family type VII secretion target n=1 Tax=Kitasatospora sp. NBC_00240 TaxID=2903567 RepID=UPI00225C245B|nr:WXG100 family type VII secretion target [Kitasatospora sp. NBC_00240]MCX5212684.1 WXG100 family type VII secretion target [Kitasatospora sp. NBC_00240]